ncbi:MAG: DUF547 domain-containing protein [Saprospiraceae bacterium]|nr:DUF547 domain-containing protein [Saprospiraceae bacterium]MCF8248686.1 DUF547 domain-containing protein [Saprospiraceae bacterium]MCF8278824.1 DUF547 domain-containing protein [Bacteroidales bacterium]MCF8310624.1 DUF547 domain-containing protein [Saprospiraceae bacterium]MCF8439183.1 DUF547 domain-containing protein [Saprospiraceae bacterium]
MRKLIIVNGFLFLLLTISCQSSPTSTASVAEVESSAPATEPAPADEASSIATAPETNQPEAKPVVEKTSPATPEKAAGTPTKPAETAAVEKPATAKTDPKPIAEQPKQQPVEVAAPPSHDAWDKLLQQYVTADGKVNYDGLKKDKTKLDAYLKTLEANPPQDDWSRAEKMAFWINAYNANTVKLIVDNYPVASITKLDGGKPWDVKRVKIGSKTYSLDNIENAILRPQFKDARIHFAVNCAAQSCPPLLNRAWTAANLESNFEKQAKAFINNSKFNKISAKSVQLSKIFEWYAADFGNLIDFLNKYATTKIGNGAKVGYLEYDWGLNRQ